MAQTRDVPGPRESALIYHFMFGPSYEAGCPTCSSMVDGLDGPLPHLHARDVTPLLVSRAPLAKLEAYKQRMSWSIPWVSSANTGFNFDFGASFTEEQVREQMPTVGDYRLAELPPIARHNADATGTDLLEYIAEAPAVSVFTLQEGAVYQTYATTWRGVEFLMGLLPDPRPNAEGARRGRCVPDLDSPARRVRTTSMRGGVGIDITSPEAQARSRGWQRRMEPLWSPVVAIGGTQRQVA